MKRSLSLLAACLLLSCNPSVTTPGNTGSSTSGQGGAGGTGGAGGAGGMGGSPDTSSTVVGTPAVCTDSTIFFDIEGDGPLQHYDVSCKPDGYLVWPGGPKPPGPPPEPGKNLFVNACSTQASYHLTVTTDPQLWPASGSILSASYQRSGVTYSLQGPGTIDVTSLGPVGGVIEGTFSVLVTDGGTSTIMLTGKFRVCREPDQIPV